MSNAFSNFFSNARRQHRLSRAISDGDLYSAADVALRNRVDHSISGRRSVKRLTAALVDQANDHTAKGNLAAAWKDLSIAGQIALRQDMDSIAQHKNQLVELTIESANALLSDGKSIHALRLIDELKSRKIMDWRADRIESTALLLRDADDLAAQGNLHRSAQKLADAQNLRPDLAFVRQRQEAVQQRQNQLRWLKDSLQSSLLNSNWEQVGNCCDQILAIAPNYQVAIDARRRLAEEKRRKTIKAHRETHYAPVAPRPTVMTEDDDVAQLNPGEQTLHAVNPQLSDTVHSGDSTVHNHKSSESASFRTRPFMIWVDGVGGYRVCPSRSNAVGQSLADSDVEIPMLGDLLRDHLRIESSGDAHVLHPQGATAIDGIEIHQPTPIKDGQRIRLGGGIELDFSQTHPLSSAAKLTFVSRHRTQPWSDGVLLASQPIIMGPRSKNHVFCPNWKQDLLLFQRKGQWFARTEGSFEIDGQTYDHEGPVQPNSRISGDDFSLSLEEI